MYIYHILVDSGLVLCELKTLYPLQQSAFDFRSYDKDGQLVFEYNTFPLLCSWKLVEHQRWSAHSASTVKQS